VSYSVGGSSRSGAAKPIRSSYVGVTYTQNGTIAISPDDENRTVTISYAALVDGKPYVPVPSSDQGGFGPLIRRNMWLVAYSVVPEPVTSCSSDFIMTADTIEFEVRWSSPVHYITDGRNAQKVWVVLRVYSCSNSSQLDSIQDCKVLLEELVQDVNQSSSRLTSKYLSMATAGPTIEPDIVKHVVQVFRVSGSGAGSPCSAVAQPFIESTSSYQKSNPNGRGYYAAIIILGLLLLVGLVFMVQYFSMPRVRGVSDREGVGGLEANIGSDGDRPGVEIVLYPRNRSSLMQEVPEFNESPVGSPMHGFSDLYQCDDDFFPKKI